MECLNEALQTRPLSGWSPFFSFQISTVQVTMVSVGTICITTRTESPFTTSTGRSMGKKIFLRLMESGASGELVMFTLGERWAENQPAMPWRQPLREIAAQPSILNGEAVTSARSRAMSRTGSPRSAQAEIWLDNPYLPPKSAPD